MLASGNSASKVEPMICVILPMFVFAAGLDGAAVGMVFSFIANW
jgi:hypothetical protein